MPSAEVYLGASRVPSGVSGLPGLSKEKKRVMIDLLGAYQSCREENIEEDITDRQGCTMAWSSRQSHCYEKGATTVSPAAIC